MMIIYTIENVGCDEVRLTNISLFSVDHRLSLYYVVVHYMILVFGSPTYYIINQKHVGSSSDD
jgi:hypothetical protein